MRIVGGALGGRRFDGPPSDLTRPTSDRVREALASALESRGAIRDAVVLDLFAGTGALTYEALSRGAERGVLVERNARVIKALCSSSCALGLRDRCRVVKRDLLRGGPDGALETAERLLALGGPYDLVFADPPYNDIGGVAPLLDALVECGAIREDAYVVVEHAKDAPPGDCRLLALSAAYRYGGTGVRLLRPTTGEVAAP